MNILVIGGMHGNETLGVELVKSLQVSPLDNVTAIIANSEALKANTRFTDQDLNRSFPGNLNSQQYELQRAAELLALCKDFDVVLDFHNTYCPDNDCSFVGDTVSSDLYKVSSFLGLERVVVAEYECINKYATNCISVEISMSSPANNVDVWLQKLKALCILDINDCTDTTTKYRFVYRMTLDDRDKLDLPSKQLQAFMQISDDLAQTMNVTSPAYPIFVADKFTTYNYGGLLNKIG